MSDLDKRALDANFKLWKKDRAEDETESRAFERYTLEQILKDSNLSDDEIDSGHFGGADDGGVDAMYFFVDRTLIQLEGESSQDSREAELILVQTKRSGGFSETVVDKIYSFIRDIFDWSTAVDDLKHLNTAARDSIELFRNTFNEILGSSPTLQISIYYVTGSEANDPDQKVVTKVEKLQQYVKSQVSYAELSIHFWDCRRLLSVVRSTPQRNFTVSTVNLFTTSDGGAVCLVRVVDLAEFLRDENGKQRRSLLESNVRAYQGRVQVNKDIRRTLESADHTKDFWWFNNGITILADSCHIAAHKLVLERPQIVNGLQTCHEVTAVQIR